jgi:hypothetical protein
MDIQLATLSDVLDFRPRELSNEEWSRLESCKGVMELRRPLKEARLPGGWAGLRNTRARRVRAHTRARELTRA